MTTYTSGQDFLRRNAADTPRFRYGSTWNYEYDRNGLGDVLRGISAEVRTLAVGVVGIANSPAASPAIEDAYIVGAAPENEFQGMTPGQIATWTGVRYAISIPYDGQQVRNRATGETLQYSTGTSLWTAIGTASTGVSTVELEASQNTDAAGGLTRSALGVPGTASIRNGQFSVDWTNRKVYGPATGGTIGPEVVDFSGAGVDRFDALAAGADIDAGGLLAGPATAADGLFVRTAGGPREVDSDAFRTAVAAGQYTDLLASYARYYAATPAVLIPNERFWTDEDGEARFYHTNASGTATVEIPLSGGVTTGGSTFDDSLLFRLDGSRPVTGPAMFSSSVTAASLAVTTGATVGGTLGVTGASTLAGLTAGSATITNDATVGGTLSLIHISEPTRPY